ncbi:MAG TPA: hypothetical protein VEK57_26285 [Thermoanaerobaculia bacterium]|nr:hypothetical protein [Thermoanaerobaculia bacterium]
MALLIAGSLLLGCSRETASLPEWSPGERVTVPGVLVAVLRESEETTLFRVTGEFSDDFEQYKTKPKVGGHPAIAEKSLPPKAAREVAEILSSGANYLPANEAWTCLPQPFYLIRARRGADVLEVVVHECGDVEMAGTIGGKRHSWQHGLGSSAGEERLWAILRSVIPSAPNCCGETADTAKN